MDALTETIRIRVTAADKARFEAEASRLGMSLSTWARVLLVSAANHADRVARLPAFPAVKIKPAKRTRK